MAMVAGVATCGVDDGGAVVGGVGARDGLDDGGWGTWCDDGACVMPAALLAAARLDMRPDDGVVNGVAGGDGSALDARIASITGFITGRGCTASTFTTGSSPAVDSDDVDVLASCVVAEGNEKNTTMAVMSSTTSSSFFQRRRASAINASAACIKQR